MASFIPTKKLVQLLGSLESNQTTFAQVLDNRIVVGTNPLRPDFEIDFEQEKILTKKNGSAGAEGMKLQNSVVQNDSSNARSSISRFMGLQWFELKGKKTECYSIKDVLINALQAIEQSHPGTLEKLSHIKKRTKRIVAKNPADLFSVKRLADDYSRQILNGWWVGTNNSSQETESWLKIAVQMAGLNWGKDFKCSL